MKTNLTYGSGLRHTLLPISAGFKGEVCPEGRFRRVGGSDVRATADTQALVPTGDAGMATGPRSWRPIT